jgi:hypothetical protein
VTSVLGDRQGSASARERAVRRSQALKERIYVIATMLAVTIVYERDGHHGTVEGAALTLLLTVLGTVGAVFVAEVIAHMVRENTLPSQPELAHLGDVSLGASGLLAAPMGILGISATGAIDLVTALRAISVTLAVTLVVVTLHAVHGLRVDPWRKAVALAITSALGLAVLAIELAVHGRPSGAD